MSDPPDTMKATRKKDTMSKLNELQNEYNEMVKIAMDSINADIDLDPQFEKELTNLMRLVKSLGGKV
jgi:hypothetical protein